MKVTFWEYFIPPISAGAFGWLAGAQSPLWAFGIILVALLQLYILDRRDQNGLFPSRYSATLKE